MGMKTRPVLVEEVEHLHTRIAAMDRALEAARRERDEAISIRDAATRAFIRECAEGARLRAALERHMNDCPAGQMLAEDLAQAPLSAATAKVIEADRRLRYAQRAKAVLVIHGKSHEQEAEALCRAEREWMIAYDALERAEREAK